MIAGTLYADKRSYNVSYTPDIVYAHRETGDLKLQLLTPAAPNIPYPPKPSLYNELKAKGLVPSYPPVPEKRRFPLIVGVPGSGWSGAEGYCYVPRMAELCKLGYVVACIEYRGTYKDDVRFPAAVQDVKEAIRFLRANADTYLVDPERVALIGDSSGGHTVAMAALTGNEAPFTIGEYPDIPTDVKSCVIFYGPNDLPNLVADRKAEGKRLRFEEDPWPFEGREIYRDDFFTDPEEKLRIASPINYISADKKMPPFIFFNGDKDPIIPLKQGERFCDKVCACGGAAAFYPIIGAGHGDGCWSEDAMTLIKKFLEATL